LRLRSISANRNPIRIRYALPSSDLTSTHRNSTDLFTRFLASNTQAQTERLDELWVNLSVRAYGYIQLVLSTPDKTASMKLSASGVNGRCFLRLRRSQATKVRYLHALCVHVQGSAGQRSPSITAYGLGQFYKCVNLFSSAHGRLAYRKVEADHSAIQLDMGEGHKQSK
jgi:hypothetical protein